MTENGCVMLPCSYGKIGRNKHGKLENTSNAVAPKGFGYLLLVKTLLNMHKAAAV